MNVVSANRAIEGNDVLSAVEAVFSAFQDPLIYTDTQRRVVWCNRGLEDMLGYSLAELAGRTTQILYAENEDYSKVGINRYSAASAGSQQSYQMSYRHKDGQILQTDTTNWPISDADGRIVGYAAILRDVTENCKVEEALNRLYAISSTQSLSGPEKIDAILALGCNFFKLPVALVSMIRGEKFTVLFSNSALMDIPPGTQFELGSTFCKDTVLADEPIAVHAADEATGNCSHPAYEEFGLRAYIGIPLIVDGERIGTLGFSSPMRRKPFSSAEYDIMKLYGAWIAQELSLEMSYQALSRAASQDWLTGAATNREFRSDLAAVFGDCKRQGRNAQLILFDIDHFKSINDRFGHDRGDMVLRSLSECVQTILGPNIPLYRIGGEEFAIVLRKATADGVMEMSERLRRGIEDIDFGYEKAFRVTASFGVSGYNADFANEGDWLKCADLALYSSKNSGRNRISSNSSMPSSLIDGNCPLSDCPGQTNCGSQNCPS